MHAVDFWVAIDVFQLLQQIWVFGQLLISSTIAENFIKKKTHFEYNYVVASLNETSTDELHKYMEYFM